MTRSFQPDNRIKHVGLLPGRMIRWIGKHLNKLRRRALVVLKYIAEQLSCYKKGYCYPSVSTIAKESGYSVRSVQYALDELVQAELISIERRPSPYGDWDHNYYRMAADLVANVTGYGGSAKASDHPPKGATHDQATTFDPGATSADKRDPTDQEVIKRDESTLERIRQMKILATNAARIAAHGAG